VTYDEAVYAIRALPDSAMRDMQDAADYAGDYWVRAGERGFAVIAAKSAAVEVSLIASGALLHIAGLR
jgi:hypothetical protein